MSTNPVGGGAQKAEAVVASDATGGAHGAERGGQLRSSSPDGDEFLPPLGYTPVFGNCCELLGAASSEADGLCGVDQRRVEVRVEQVQ